MENKEDKWISVKERLPEKIGSYLCISNDEKYMVCYLSLNGWWSKVPDARYFGDMGGRVVVDSKEIEREVNYWQPLPEPPKEL